jgi:hypothetical protein
MARLWYQAIARTLDSIPHPDRTLVGVCTFDSTIHFYALRPGASQPHMLVAGAYRITNDLRMPNDQYPCYSVLTRPDSPESLLEHSTLTRLP